MNGEKKKKKKKKKKGDSYFLFTEKHNDYNKTKSMIQLSAIIAVLLLVGSVEGQCDTSCPGLFAEYQRRAKKIGSGYNSSMLLRTIHTPDVVISGDFGFVTVGDGGMDPDSGLVLIHPMSGRDLKGIVHYIDAILVVNQDEEMVAFKQFSPVTSSSSSLTFRIPKGTTGIKAYSFCNIHGMFESEVVTVLPSVGSTQAKCYPEICNIDPTVLMRVLSNTALNEPLTDVFEIERHTPRIYPVNDTHLEIGFDSISGSTMDTNQDADPNTIHYIDAIFVTDENNQTIFSRVYPPSDDLPMETFEIPDGVSEVTPHAHCNRYGMYSGTTTTTNSSGTAANTNNGCMLCSNPLSNWPGYQAVRITNASCLASKDQLPACIDGINKPDDKCKCAYDGNSSTVTLKFVGKINVNQLIVKNPIGNVAYTIQQCGGMTCPNGLFTDSVDIVADGAIAADELIIDGTSSYTDIQKQSNVYNCAGGSPLASEARRKQITTFGTAIQTQSGSVKHTPFISVRSSKRGKVTVGGSGPVNVGDISADDYPSTPLHPMNPDHFIDTIFVVNQDNVVIASSALLPTKYSSPTFEFDIPTNTTSLTAYEHCNIHGLYKGPTTVLTIDSTSTIPVGQCNNDKKFQMCGNKQKGMSPICDTQEMCSFLPQRFQSSAVSTYDRKHTPKITLPDGGVGVVNIELPYHPYAVDVSDITDPFTSHIISYLWAVDAETGIVLAFGIPDPFKPASLSFYNGDANINIIAYSHCDIHGTFKSLNNFNNSVDIIMCNGDAAIPNGQCIGLGESSCGEAIAVSAQYDGAPLTGSGAIDKHVPRLEINGMMARLTVGSVGNIHPMTPSDDKDIVHYIDTAWITVNNDIPLYVWYPTPDFNGTLVLEFTLPPYVTSVKPHIHCNKHGKFSGATYPVAMGNATVTFPPEVCEIKPCTTDPTPMDCNSAMAELLRLNETASIVRSPSILTHTPYIVVRGKKGVVTVGAPVSEEATPFHPMTPGSTPHYINKLLVQDDMKNTIAYGSFLPTEPYAQMIFDIPAGTLSIKAFEFCNLHGLYEGAVVDTSTIWINGEQRGEPSCQISNCMATSCTNNLFPASDLPPPATATPTTIGDSSDGNNSFLIAIIMILVLLLLSGVVFMGYRMRKARKNADPFRNNKNSFIETKNLIEDGKEMDTAL